MQSKISSTGIPRVIETAVMVCMNTHVYSFGEDLYLQLSGGPIGMRFTAALANVVMKYWDFKWLELMKREKVMIDLYLRYVDDCRQFMPVINKGWYWCGQSFVFSKQREREDHEKNGSDE